MSVVRLSDSPTVTKRDSSAIVTRGWAEFKTHLADNDKGILNGIASTVVVDRMGDVLEPKGAKFSLPLPLLWQHNARQPIGKVTHAEVSDNEISITAQVFKGADIPFITEAWQLIRNGLVKGLSVGLRVLDSKPLKGGIGRHVTSWELLEVSCVTLAANQEASIITVKNCDEIVLKELGLYTPLMTMADPQAWARFTQECRRLSRATESVDDLSLEQCAAELEKHGHQVVRLSTLMAVMKGNAQLMGKLNARIKALEEKEN